MINIKFCFVMLALTGTFTPTGGRGVARAAQDALGCRAEHHGHRHCGGVQEHQRAIITTEEMRATLLCMQKLKKKKIEGGK